MTRIFIYVRPYRVYYLSFENCYKTRYLNFLIKFTSYILLLVLCWNSFSYHKSQLVVLIRWGTNYWYAAEGTMRDNGGFIDLTTRFAETCSQWHVCRGIFSGEYSQRHVLRNMIAGTCLRKRFLRDMFSKTSFQRNILRDMFLGYSQRQVMFLGYSAYSQGHILREMFAETCLRKQVLMMFVGNIYVFSNMLINLRLQNTLKW